MKMRCALIALLFLLAGGGCGMPQPYLSPLTTPTQPGSMDHQDLMRSKQLAAHRYDPFPSDTMGPAIDELRPRDYDRPPGDVFQSRWWTPQTGQVDSWWNRSGF
jgi:hypothetical protein